MMKYIIEESDIIVGEYFVKNYSFDVIGKHTQKEYFQYLQSTLVKVCYFGGGDEDRYTVVAMTDGAIYNSNLTSDTNYGTTKTILAQQLSDDNMKSITRKEALNIMMEASYD